MKLFKRTIVILISVILGVFIGIYFLAFFSPTDKNTIKDKEINTIMAMLKENDIKCSKGIIPKSYPELPEYLLYNALHDKLTFSENLLGDDFSIEDSKTYSDDTGTLSFVGNNFTLRFTEPYPFDEELLKTELSSRGFQESEMLISVKSEEQFATVLKTIDGFPVFDCGFNINFYEDGISKIKGTWFNKSDKTSYKKHRSLVSVFSEICENPDFKDKKITDITAGYKIDITSDYQKEATAHPVWRITFDDKTTMDYDM